MVPGPTGPKFGRRVQHVGRGPQRYFWTLGTMSGVPGLGKGYFWRSVGAFLDEVHKTKVVRHPSNSMGGRVWNFTKVSTSRSMAPGRFCSRGPLADGPQT